MVDEVGEDASELRLPESVQGMIAARLDALPIEEKLLLQDAAVVGKVFWLGPLSQIGDRDRRRGRAAPAPARAEGVRAPRASFVRRRGEPVRLQPPARRGRRVLADPARRPIGEASGAPPSGSSRSGRPEDHAEMLAHHYLTALELDRAAGVETEELATRARLRLREAGDRAYALSAFPAARRFYGAAIELWPAGRRGPTPTCSSATRGSAMRSSPTKSLEPHDRGSGRVARCRGSALRRPRPRSSIGEVFWLLGQRDEGVRTSARGRGADRRSAELVLQGVRRRERVAFLDARRGARDGIRIGREALAMADELEHRRAAVARAQQHRHRPSRERRRGWARRPGAEPSRSRGRQLDRERSLIRQPRVDALADLGELERRWAMQRRGASSR